MQKTWIRIILGLITIILIGGGLFFILRDSEKNVPSVPPPSEVVTSTPDIPNPEPMPNPNPFPDDDDRDGLSNTEEVELGTDPHNFDTDNDSLSDVTEVRDLHTDPKKADTDGDGFNDGVEVLHGYNPSGEGSLRKP